MVHGGTVQTSGRRAGSTATYTCQNGFIMSGQAVRRCRSTESTCFSVHRICYGQMHVWASHNSSWSLWEGSLFIFFSAMSITALFAHKGTPVLLTDYHVTLPLSFTISWLHSNSEDGYRIILHNFHNNLADYPVLQTWKATICMPTAMEVSNAHLFLSMCVCVCVCVCVRARAHAHVPNSVSQLCSLSQKSTTMAGKCQHKNCSFYKTKFTTSVNFAVICIGYDPSQFGLTFSSHKRTVTVIKKPVMKVTNVTCENPHTYRHHKTKPDSWVLLLIFSI